MSIAIEDSTLETPLFTSAEATRWLHIPCHRSEPERISFRSLASLFVESAVFHLLPRSEWQPNNPQFETFRQTIRRVVDDPRLHSDANGVSARLAPGMSSSDRDRLKRLIALHQSRVESMDGVPVRRCDSKP